MTNTPNKTILSFSDNTTSTLVNTQAVHNLIVDQFVDVFSFGKSSSSIAFSDGTGKVIVTLNGHGLSDGDFVGIYSTNYTGGYKITYIGVNSFSILATWVAADSDGLIFIPGYYTGIYKILSTPTDTSFEIDKLFKNTELGFCIEYGSRQFPILEESSFAYWLAAFNRTLFDIGNKSILTTTNKDLVCAINECHVWTRDDSSKNITPFYGTDNLVLGDLSWTDSTSTLAVTGTVDVDTLQVNLDATVDGDLNVTVDVNVTEDLNVTLDASVGGTLHVVGNSTFDGDLTVIGDLNEGRAE